MTNHDTGHPDGRETCDALLAALRLSFPEAIRKPGKAQCALNLGQGSNVAYAFHIKTRPKLDIYFPSRPHDSFEKVGNIVPTLRKTLGNGWADKFAWHFVLPEARYAMEGARFLLDAAGLGSTERAPAPGRTLPAFAEEVPPDVYPEGAVTQVTVNRFERDPKARSECIRIHGSSCAICGFDFADRYGPSFEGLITVHHLKPLSEIRSAYSVHPADDLRPLCANCHLIVHRRAPPYTIDEVKRMLEKERPTSRRHVPKTTRRPP
jgi:5-methylcytosine-specific restriction endonuclease McrA